MTKKRKVTRAKKQKLVGSDGLGPKEIKQIRTALRKVWSWSTARRLVVKRCQDKKDPEYSKCEKCKKRCPKIYVDHIVACGDVDSGYIERLFIPSKYLQGMCKKCHGLKTKMERAVASCGF